MLPLEGERQAANETFAGRSSNRCRMGEIPLDRDGTNGGGLMLMFAVHLLQVSAIAKQSVCFEEHCMDSTSAACCYGPSVVYYCHERACRMQSPVYLRDQ